MRETSQGQATIYVEFYKDWWKRNEKKTPGEMRWISITYKIGPIKEHLRSRIMLTTKGIRPLSCSPIYRYIGLFSLTVFASVTQARDFLKLSTYVQVPKSPRKRPARSSSSTPQASLWTSSFLPRWLVMDRFVFKLNFAVIDLLFKLLKSIIEKENKAKEKKQ